MDHGLEAPTEVAAGAEEAPEVGALGGPLGGHGALALAGGTATLTPVAVVASG